MMSSASAARVRHMVLCALFAALTAICSQIAVPMPWGVPINLALFAVCMAGAMLGPVWGTASMVVFVALAAIGVPVLAGFQGGPAAIFGKTGGYAVGYI
ncbi:MAG: biotin transporter BioY, partial [Blautia massiliensis (ex Durand et al. 2017)]